MRLFMPLSTPHYPRIVRPGMHGTLRRWTVCAAVVNGVLPGGGSSMLASHAPSPESAMAQGTTEERSPPPTRGRPSPVNSGSRGFPLVSRATEHSVPGEVSFVYPVVFEPLCCPHRIPWARDTQGKWWGLSRSAYTSSPPENGLDLPCAEAACASGITHGQPLPRPFRAS